MMKFPTKALRDAPAIVPGHSLFALRKKWRVWFLFYGDPVTLIASREGACDLADAINDIRLSGGFDDDASIHIGPISGGWVDAEREQDAAIKMLSRAAGDGGFFESRWDVLKRRLADVGYTLPTKTEFRSGSVSGLRLEDIVTLGGASSTPL